MRRVLDGKKTVAVDGQVAIRPTLHRPVFIAYSTGMTNPWSFRFLNSERHFEPENIDWVCSDMPRLWRYNLHYFDYLQDPSIAQTAKDFLIRDWIEKNPSGTETAWEPYTVSLRIVNWVKYFLTRGDANGLPPIFVRNLALQSEWLYHNLEYHILANHYFKNIKALLFSACYVQCAAAERWFLRGEKLLCEQIDEQLLSDGGHYERSPMYHSIFTEDLIDILNISTELPYQESTLVMVKDAAVRASLFLRDLLMPDGQIPLFNDAAFAIAPEPQTILEYAGRILDLNLQDRQSHPPSEAFSDSGYFILGDADNRMIIDCGECGPRYQPGHTHCDLLSYELAVAGQRTIVDTGTFNYEPGAARRYDRSTAAHNTVRIDGQEQSEVWGLFRVARRASPLSAKLFTDNSETQIFCGSHDGYRRLADKVTHLRRVEFKKDRGWMIEDRLEGQGQHHVESFIHIHPELSIEEKNDGLHLLNSNRSTLVILQIPQTTDFEISNAFYHPQFGIEKANKVIRLYFRGELPCVLVYRVKLAKTVF